MGVAVLFPGQASQYVGMGNAWYRASGEARLVFERADALLGYPLSKLCFEGPEERLNRTEITQPAVFVTALAMWEAARSRLPRPDFFAGHSLGEFTALTAAGVLTFEDGLRIVARRGALMAEVGQIAPGGMAALIGVGPEKTEALCRAVTAERGETLVVANDNNPRQVVISGTLRALEMAESLAGEYGIRRFVRLAISIAPHSPLMQPVQEALAALLDEIPFHPPRTPVVLNRTAAPVDDVKAIKAAVVQQLTSPVRWRESVLWMGEHGIDHFIEVGPKDVLMGLVRRTLRKAHVEALDTVDVEAFLG